MGGGKVEGKYPFFFFWKCVCKGGYKRYYVCAKNIFYKEEEPTRLKCIYTYTN